MPFTSETARAAGKKSKRGKAKISMSTRRFLYEMLIENKEKYGLYFQGGICKIDQQSFEYIHNKSF